MNRLRGAASLVSIVIAALAVAAAPARAEGWSLGANLGFQHFDPSEGAGSVTYFVIPNGPGVFSGPTPGLRIGFGVAGQTEFFTDLGFSRISDDDASLTTLLLTFNVQHAFSPSTVSPYVTVGAGVHSVSTSFEGPFVDVDDSDISGIFGGGLGVRRIVSQGHGAIRGEVRLDYVTENDLFFPSGLLVGVKLGFDLWMR